MTTVFHLDLKLKISLLFILVLDFYDYYCNFYVSALMKTSNLAIIILAII